MTLKKRTVILLGIIFLAIFLLSFYHITQWKKDSDHTDKQINQVQDIVEIKSTEDNDNTEIIEQEEIPAFNPYWDYIKMDLIDVNLEELKGINKDVVGWIEVKGTNINYPFVQSSDNKYYLTHSFDQSVNSAGWVFLDYRNKKEELSKNNIIYAHGRTDKTMFGSLKNILSNGWFDNTSNHVIRLSTDTENTLWQVFSVYRIPTTNDYIQVNFRNNYEFLQFINMLLERSNHKFNTTVNEKDTILTLSTCYNNSDKVVLHAKLIKREKK